MKTGAQLYTIKSYTQNVKDFACSMKKIAEMGYKTVQISAVGKDLKPEQIREICDANGLEIALTHSDPIESSMILKHLLRSMISWDAATLDLE